MLIAITALNEVATDDTEDSERFPDSSVFSVTSVAGSFSNASNVSRYPRSVPSTVRSMGFLSAAWGGRSDASLARIARPRLGNVQTHNLGAVGGQDARPAGVGHDGDTAAADPLRDADEPAAEVEQLLGGLDPDRAALAQRGIVDRVAAGERASVG